MGNVYLIRLYNDAEEFYKIGITVHRYCRFYEIMKSGYRIEIVRMVMGIKYLIALDLESKLKSLFPSYIPLVKFGGYTECFSEVNLNDFSAQFDGIQFNEVVDNLEISWR